MDISDPDTVELELRTSGIGESDLDIADGLMILRYEEHITKLLVTIAELNHKVECLQHKMGSREDDEYTDQCSQYTASLPRCVRKPLSYSVFETLPFPEAHAGEDESSDLFLELQKVVASLESMVYSRRNHTKSPTSSKTAMADGDLSLAREEWAKTTKALEEIEQGLGIMPIEGSRYEEEISSFRDRNTALRVMIGDKELELERSKVTMRAFQEERDKLQRKVYELQSSLQKMETPLSLSPRCTEGPNSTAYDKGPWAIQDAFGDPIMLAQNLMRCLQAILGTQHLYQLFSVWHQPLASHSSIKALEAETQQLRGYLDKLWILNDLLAVTLEECKSDSERLSMLLGKQQSKSTMLQLSLQYSERCTEAYTVLLAQTDWKLERVLEQVLGKSHGERRGAQKWRSIPQVLDCPAKLVILEAKKVLKKGDHEEGEKVDSGPGFLYSWSPVVLSSEDEVLLKEYIQKMKEDHASVTVALASLRTDGACHSTEVARLNDVIRAKVDDAIEAALDILPGIVEKPKLDKMHLQHNLMAIREAISELKTRLHLTEKEKEVLELQTLAHGAQKAACLLLTEHLQWELEEWTGKQTESSSGGSNGMGGDSERKTPVTKPEEDPSGIQELIQSLTRSSELRGYIRTLLLSLEKLMKDSSSQKLWSIQITTGIFRDHSDLIFAYKDSKKKYKDQLEKLQMQVASVSERHKEELHCLKQTIQSLEECREKKVSGETAL